MKTTDFEKRMIKFIKHNLKLVSIALCVMFLITFISLWIWGYEASSGTKLVSDFVVNIFGSIMWITILMVAAIGIYSAFRACNVLLIEDEVTSAKSRLKDQNLERYSDKEILAYAKLGDKVREMLDKGEFDYSDAGLKDL